MRKDHCRTLLLLTVFFVMKSLANEVSPKDLDAFIQKLHPLCCPELSNCCVAKFLDPQKDYAHEKLIAYLMQCCVVKNSKSTAANIAKDDNEAIQFMPDEKAKRKNMNLNRCCHDPMDPDSPQFKALGEKCCDGSINCCDGSLSVLEKAGSYSDQDLNTFYDYKWSCCIGGRGSDICCSLKEKPTTTTKVILTTIYDDITTPDDSDETTEPGSEVKVPSASPLPSSKPVPNPSPDMANTPQPAPNPDDNAAGHLVGSTVVQLGVLVSLAAYCLQQRLFGG